LHEKGSRAFRNPAANPWCVETLDGYLERLASKDAVPGGGSAAALTGEIAAALVAMVGRIQAAPLQGLVPRADRLRAGLERARQSDEKAYGAVVAAQAKPKRTEAEIAARRRALESALERAAQAPLQTAALVVQLLKLTDRLAKTPMGALASDVGSAAELAHAAVSACGYNVRINHRYMHDDAAIRKQAATLVALEGEATRILKRVRDAVGEMKI
jgi:formiminotetrahydrofolate cyclodeaminase